MEVEVLRLLRGLIPTRLHPHELRPEKTSQKVKPPRVVKVRRETVGRTGRVVPLRVASAPDASLAAH